MHRRPAEEETSQYAAPFIGTAQRRVGASRHTVRVKAAAQQFGSASTREAPNTRGTLSLECTHLLEANGLSVVTEAPTAQHHVVLADQTVAVAAAAAARRSQPHATRHIDVDSLQHPARRHHQLLDKRASSFAAAHRFEAAANVGFVLAAFTAVAAAHQVREPGPYERAWPAQPRGKASITPSGIFSNAAGGQVRPGVRRNSKIAAARPAAKLARLLRDVLLVSLRADTAHTRIRGDTTNARCRCASVGPWLQSTERFAPF